MVCLSSRTMAEIGYLRGAANHSASQGLKLTVSMIPLPIGVALRHGGCRWAMA